jgi:hypothetical protein
MIEKSNCDVNMIFWCHFFGFSIDEFNWFCLPSLSNMDSEQVTDSTARRMLNKNLLSNRTEIMQ